MGEASSGLSKAVNRVLVVTVAFAALVNAYGVIVVGVIAGVLPVLVLELTFTLLFAVLGYGCWRRKRWAYLGVSILSLTSVGVLSEAPGAPGLVSILQNPALSGNENFVVFFPYYVALATAILYSSYGFYVSRRTQLFPGQVGKSSVLTFVALGVLIGGLVVGGFAATTESHLLASAGGPADVTIVLGASSSSNPSFYSPSNFTAKVGQTVTWVNRDSAAHTVTSTTGLFSSGDMASGATFSFTFTKVGILQYYCTIHPWMKGTIVVTGG
jgi:plastocyanin